MVLRVPRGVRAWLRTWSLAEVTQHAATGLKYACLPLMRSSNCTTWVSGRCADSNTVGMDVVDFDREIESCRGERTGLQARPLSFDMDLSELTFFILLQECICKARSSCEPPRIFYGTADSIQWLKFTSLSRYFTYTKHSELQA
jgi:hypothetical protein